jgi:5-methylcytosine-specific restriction endonuclease McrA
MIRRRVLRRDGHRCQIKGPGCTGIATDVDHIGDRHDHSEANLRAVCGWCHRQRSAAQGHARQRALKQARKRPPERHPGDRRVRRPEVKFSHALKLVHKLSAG